MDTDANNVKIRGVILDGQEKVEASKHNTLSRTQRNYSVTWQKFLAIAKILKHFHKHRHEHKFHLSTDHSAMTWQLGFKNLERHRACCAHCLKEYNLHININRDGSIPAHMHSLEQYVRKSSNIQAVPRHKLLLQMVGIMPILGGSRWMLTWNKHYRKWSWTMSWVEGPHWPQSHLNWDQQNSKTVRYRVLESQREVANRWTKTKQTDFPQSMVMEVLVQLHGGPLRQYLGVKITQTKPDSSINGYTWEAVPTNNATPVQQNKVSKSWHMAWCTSITLGHHTEWLPWTSPWTSPWTTQDRSQTSKRRK
jgi:hypothetical protein